MAVPDGTGGVVGLALRAVGAIDVGFICCRPGWDRGYSRGSPPG